MTLFERIVWDCVVSVVSHFDTTVRLVRFARNHTHATRRTIHTSITINTTSLQRQKPQEHQHKTMSNFADFDAVKALVEKYVDGIRTGDTVKLVEAFHPRAFVMGHGEKLGFKGHFPADKFIEILKQNPTLAGPTYEATIRSMDITNDAGVVVLEESDFHGCNFVNYLSVSKLEGQWSITNKTYTMTGTAN